MDGTDTTKNDWGLCEVLTLLEDDILSTPGKLIALDSTLLARLNSLIGGIDVDINSPLSADDECSGAMDGACRQSINRALGAARRASSMAPSTASGT
ncbi:type II toxin-antitoxin system PrlF family antitoxin [Pseudomonas sp. ZY71]|uniref:type II toxin-antitoxin system PrlF family antitoxin n=1 Tax=Pseudomonas sp. ZY71 TaxID=3115647 RepID=UPI003FA6C291